METPLANSVTAGPGTGNVPWAPWTVPDHVDGRGPERLNPEFMTAQQGPHNIHQGIDHADFMETDGGTVSSMHGAFGLGEPLKDRKRLGFHPGRQPARRKKSSDLRPGKRSGTAFGNDDVHFRRMNPAAVDL